MQLFGLKWPVVISLWCWKECMYIISKLKWLVLIFWNFPPKKCSHIIFKNPILFPPTIIPKVSELSQTTVMFLVIYELDNTSLHLNLLELPFPFQFQFFFVKWPTTIFSSCNLFWSFCYYKQEEGPNHLLHWRKTTIKTKPVSIHASRCLPRRKCSAAKALVIQLR